MSSLLLSFMYRKGNIHSNNSNSNSNGCSQSMPLYSISFYTITNPKKDCVLTFLLISPSHFSSVLVVPFCLCGVFVQCIHACCHDCAMILFCLNQNHVESIPDLTCLKKTLHFYKGREGWGGDEGEKDKKEMREV